MPFGMQKLADLFGRLRGKEKKYKYEDELEIAKMNFLRDYTEKPKQLTMQSADFRWIEKLGTGGYSKVFLAKHLGMKQYWAIKVLKKTDITNVKHLEHMKNEIKIHLAIEFPFIVGFRGHFEGNFNHYFILDYCGGGSLEKQFLVSARFPEEHVKFYAANVFLALEFLHSIDIVYRDLKPENLLLDEDGYIKLSDLGFAKMVRYRTTTFCGTNEYYAPEMFSESSKGSGKGYGKEVDWWTFGVLLYELATGTVPFPAQDQATYKKAVTSNLQYEFPDYLSQNFKDLVGRLITSSRTRYGGLHKNYKLIQDHPWFQDINWDEIYEKKVKAPAITWKSPQSFEKHTTMYRPKINAT